MAPVFVFGNETTLTQTVYMFGVGGAFACDARGFSADCSAEGQPSFYDWPSSRWPMQLFHGLFDFL
jgi:hypothetical protein